MEALRQQLQQAEDRLIRAKAENENYRKRTQRELANARTIAKAGTIEEFLTVFDHFQMAMDHAESSDDAEALHQGMKLIQTEFERAFQNLGVERIDAVGASFDPEQHHAVAEEESAEAREGTVIRQWKPGYRIGDRLIRPASVVVSKAAVEEEPDETGEMPTAEEDEAN
jgi:molecular chaperone GrpE